MTTYGSDTFTRSNTTSPSWGTATDGETWTRPNGSATTYNVSSNEGVINNTPSTWDHFVLGSNTISTTMDVLVRFVCDAVTTSNAGVLLRTSSDGKTNYKVIYDGIDGLGLALYYDSPGTSLVQIGTNSAFTPVVGSAYWVRGQINGTTLMGKIWKDGNAEPGTWTISSSVGTHTITSGGFGILGAATNNLKFDHFTASDGATTTISAQSVTETNVVTENIATVQSVAITGKPTATEQVQVVQSVSVTETTPITETVSTASISWQSVTETTAIIEQADGVTIATPVPGAPGGVRLLINDVYYPTIRQETINIDRTASDPIPTFKVTLQDDPSGIGISELQEVIFIDASQTPNPTHNLLRNPFISSYTTNWTQTSVTGGTFTQQTPGVQLTASNVASNFGLSQLTQNGLIVPGQAYMLSCYVQSTGLTNIAPFLSVSYLAANGNSLGMQSITLPTNTVNTRYTLAAQAPPLTATVQVSFGLSPTSGTNSGNSTFTNIQFEPMSFLTGNAQQYYPTAFCAPGLSGCHLLPDSTTVRQYRLFGGLVTKATAGRYIGNNRQWTITVSGYAWLFQKQLLNNSYTSRTDSSIINALIGIYFPTQFSTAQVATGATLDVFGYTYNGTMRDAMDALAANANYYYYVDAYRTIYFQPPGYQQISFMLSDQPDGVMSFPYYNYSLDIDGTQLGNACLVTGATNISAVEYDGQSIGWYNQKTNGQGIFWRTVNDSTITTNAAAQQRAIAEITEYNYARNVVHLTTNQMMIPGYTVLFSSRTDQLNDVPFLIQKATITLKGFQSQGVATYECVCDLGAFNPDLVNITVKLLRKQLTNANNVGTPAIGLMATDQFTFIDTVTLTPIASSGGGHTSTYSMGVYGTSTYASSVPSVPSTMYGIGTYGDGTKGYA